MVGGRRVASSTFVGGEMFSLQFLHSPGNRAAVRIQTISRRTSMQAQTKTTNSSAPAGTRIGVKTKTGRWQQPQAVELKAPAASSQNISLLRNFIQLGRGVPFSPLND
jgi:hypothetical protein